MIRHPASLHRLQQGTVRRLQRYYQDAMPSCCSSRRTSLPSFGGTSTFHSLCSLSGGRVSRRSLELVTRCLQPGLAEETTGPPKFLENPNCPFAHDPSDSGRTADTRPSRCSSVAPGQSTTKAPAKGLSKLNSMAFGLAVYASQCALPRPTQDSLPAAGQALPDGLSTRKVPMKGFRFASYISSPFPKLLGAMIATAAVFDSAKTASV